MAHSLNKTCVVECETLTCSEKKRMCKINGVKLHTGDYISINGRKGSVYKGAIKVN